MIPLLGNKSRPEPSEELTNNAGGLMSKFNPSNLVRGLVGGKRSGSSMGDMIGTDRQKLKSAVSPKNKDPELTTVGASDISPVRKGDSVANVAAKVYNLINGKYDERKKEIKLENKLTQELAIKKEKRHTELLRALSERPKQKVTEVKVPKKEEPKPTPQAAPKPSAPQAAAPKPTTPQAAAPKPASQAAAPKPGAPQAAAPKPTTPQAPQAAAPKPTTPQAAAPKPTTPQAPQAAAPKPAAPTAAPAAPAVPSAAPITQAAPAVSTATQVAVGTALVAASSYSFAAGPLAENIVAHESKVSSPLRRDGKKITTKWKNDSEYNAYNKGTKIAADFDEKGESVIDFSKMTIEEYLQRGSIKDPKNPKKIFAMGRYQIIPDTMKFLVKNLNIDPKTTYLTKETQDYLFMAGIIGTKRKKVKAYIDGDAKVTRDEAILELSQEFASIGVPYDTKYKGKVIKKGQSYYGQNTKSGFALNPPEEVGKALDAERERQTKLKQKSTPSNVPGQGKKLGEASTENADLKKTASSGQSTIIMNNNTTVAAMSPTNQTMVAPKSDASKFVQGVGA